MCISSGSNLPEITGAEMKKIYIVIPEDKWKMLVMYFSVSGYSVHPFHDDVSAGKAFDSDVPDMLITDVSGKIDGFRLVKEMKTKYPELLVVFLVSSSDEYDRILGFELGCDDYITEPYSPKELLLRINAIFRRNEIKTEKELENISVYRSSIYRLVIDNMVHMVSIDGNVIKLTSTEWELLSLLASNASCIVSRDKIDEYCFPDQNGSYKRVADSHIKNLRKKLKPGVWIDTIRGFCYKFIGKLVIE